MSKFHLISAAVGLVAIAVGVFTWLAYQNTPVGTWRTMRQAGCDGDVAAFTSRLDRSQVAEGFSREAIGRGGLNPNSKLAELGTAMAFNALTAWEDEVKRGSAGAICGWVFVDSAGEYVRFVTVTGDARVARFEKFDGRWLMVGFERDDASR